MRFRSLFVVIAATLSGAALVPACGPGGSMQATGTTGSGGATAGSSATTGTTGSGGATATTGSGGAATGSGGGGPDASSDAPFVPGMFVCEDCLCDGTTHYCSIHSVGAPKLPPPPMCEDAGAYGCQPFPASCGASPTCACPALDDGPPCTCSAMNGGITVTCALP